MWIIQHLYLLQINFDIINCNDIFKGQSSIMMEWNNGLNLGIDSLDNEHKYLMEIINRLSEALCHDVGEELINETFEEFIKALQEHSKNEEDILKNCNYKDLHEHSRHHHDFINKVKELKIQCSTSIATGIHTNDIASTIMDLLLTHIITEDIPVIKIFEKYGLIKQNENSTYLLQQLIKNITDTISFTKRILLSALIPLMGMLVLGFIILIGDYNQHKQIKQTSNITKVILNVNSLSHSLQIERGLSSGHLSSNSDKFQKNLQGQHKVVNTAIKEFLVKIDSIDKNKIRIIHEHIKTFKADRLNIKKFRQSVIDKNTTNIQTMDFYTKIIKNILDITSKIASFNLEPETHASVSGLSSLLQYKEALGQTRAYGTIIIEEKKLSTKEYVNFIQLLNTQKIFLELFNQYASPSQKKRKTALVESLLSTDIYTYIQNIKNQDFRTLDSEIWFAEMTKYINSVNIFENQLLNEINTLLDNRLKKNVDKLILWIMYIGFIIIITIFIIYLFERSSKGQLYQLTDAMKYLANGGRDLRLKPTTLKDALSQMYDAYEITRQRLLHGDLYTDLYQKQKDKELKKQLILNDELEDLASIDPLTSCVNRRKFEELSNLELQRSSRYNNDFTLLMLDIDLFKSINDTYGHLIGDKVLKHFSSVCLELAREMDIVARIGGEEFVVMLPHTDSDGAFIFAERFREQIYNSELIIDEHKIKYSVSIGISSFNRDNDTEISMILHRADLALYEAKENGRNRSIIYKEQK